MNRRIGPAAGDAAARAGIGFAAERRPHITASWLAATGGRRRGDRVDFGRVNRAALAVLPSLLQRWLPDGRIEGAEYTARNPTRADKRPGSFKINLRSGKWADFATGDKGGDPIALAAYVNRCSQVEAARQLADMLGLAADG
jgi:hypothetical protein